MFAPGLTVIGPVTPMLPPEGVVAVMVGVCPALVSVKPGTVTVPLANVWLPSATMVGAVELGELVASCVQFTIRTSDTVVTVLPEPSTAVTVMEKAVPATSVPLFCVSTV